MRCLASFAQPKNWLTASRSSTKVLLLTLGICLLASIPTTTASAASAVTYSLSPTSGQYQPGASVPIEVSIKATQAFAGASVDVKPGNMTFQSFSTANAPQFILVDYHKNARDIVVICQNNNCPAGTYKVGTLYFKAGTSGSMSLKLTPVETADTDLKQISASGASGSYSIAQSASPSPPAPSGGSTYTIPRAGNGPSIVPAQIGEQERTEQEEEILPPSTGGAFISDSENSGKSRAKSSMPLWLVFFPLAFVMAAIGFIAGRRTRNQAPYPYMAGTVVQPPNNNVQQPPGGNDPNKF